MQRRREKKNHVYYIIIVTRLSGLRENDGNINHRKHKRRIFFRFDKSLRCFYSHRFRLTNETIRYEVRVRILYCIHAEKGELL